jgi:hypothetical protein
MTLEELRTSVEKDMVIDKTSLDSESLKIPQLHNKYLNHFHDARFVIKKLKQDYKILETRKWEYYSGRMSEEELRTFGWTQFPHRVLKGDIERYLSSDADLVTIQNRITLHEEKILYLEEVLKMIANRGWQIRNAIDWIRFTHGVNS